MGRPLLYTCNDRFLDGRIRKDAAYWLGWMFADGYLNTKNNSVRFSIADSDREVLHELKRIMGFRGEVKTQYRKPSSVMGQPVKKHQDRACIQVFSGRISAKLQKLGLDQRKSVSTGFPFYLDKAQWKRFMLGLYEGDGTFSFSEKNHKAETNIVVNPVIAKDLEGILKDELNIECHYAKRGAFANGAVTLRFCGNSQVLRFFSWLYEDNTFRLTRKYNVFKRLLQHKQSVWLKTAEERRIVEKAQRIIDQIQHAT